MIIYNRTCISFEYLMNQVTRLPGSFLEFFNNFRVSLIVLYFRSRIPQGHSPGGGRHHPRLRHQDRDQKTETKRRKNACNK